MQYCNDYQAALCCTHRNQEVGFCGWAHVHHLDTAELCSEKCSTRFFSHLPCWFCPCSSWGEPLPWSPHEVHLPPVSSLQRMKCAMPRPSGQPRITCCKVHVALQGWCPDSQPAEFRNLFEQRAVTIPCLSNSLLELRVCAAAPTALVGCVPKTQSTSLSSARSFCFLFFL